MNAQPEIPVRSYAEDNKQLLAAFDRYLQARGSTIETRRAYSRPLARLAEAIGSQNIADIERFQIREMFTRWELKGLHANSIRLYTTSFRTFYRFLNLSGVTKQNPMLLVAHRKVPSRVPLVLSVADVERLIAVARDPLDRAVVEVLYATGVRISEFIKLRLSDISWGDPSALRVHKGKGGKDRLVLLGKSAANAIHEYQRWRPSMYGYLFEAPPRKPERERPYHAGAIRDVLKRLAHRAGIPLIYPHALRRAFATHMLQRRANLRAVQDLLGHERVNTTMLYTTLTAEDLRRVYEDAHPHAHGKGETDNDRKE